jgi:alanine dehydrogenase
MTLLLTNDEVDRLLDMRECIDVLESAYRELGQGIGVTRTVSQVFTPTRHGADALYSFKSMDGVAPFLEVAAIRLASEILTFPKDTQGHAKKIRIGAAPGGRFVGLVLLFSTSTGEPLAIFPDGVIQRTRVGATTALAAKYLARPDASEVAMLGCGWQAAAQVRAITVVRKVEKVRCFSPSDARRAAFAREMEESTGISVIACASPEAAVKGADVVLCATNSWSPVFFADWIEPGVHLNTVQHAELHPDVFKAADVLVAHYSGGRPAVIDSSRGIVHAESTESMRNAVARGHRRGGAAEPARPRARAGSGPPLARRGHGLPELCRPRLSVRRSRGGALPQRRRARRRPQPADRLVHGGREPVMHGWARRMG